MNQCQKYNRKVRNENLDSTGNKNCGYLKIEQKNFCVWNNKILNRTKKDLRRTCGEIWKNEEDAKMQTGKI